MKKLLSCCPVAKEEFLHLIPRDFQFQPGRDMSAWQAKVWWLQESQAQVCMMRGKQLMAYGGIYTDREGYLSSVDQAYRECKQMVASYSLTERSMDSVQIRVDIRQIPVFPLFSKPVKFSWDKHNPWHQYEQVAGYWNELEHPDQPISPKNLVRPINIHTLLQEHVIWHSKLPQKEHMSVLEKFKECWHLEPLEEQMHSHYLAQTKEKG
ncbi:hypothetical protein HF888_02550 [Bermanella marisrubri]|uniref:Uncharacterized protein n=1 Tax=Bermanella marisrubri TaxID=207949 RepID=Q1N3L8_9GAMM|nr:hypothetical protein [Bermanella marisrubri]EAT12856.1 hypothetical protein RED65_12324 [Oceanobacter sp. RED65] [Bermanella marisrubri]QIZ83177.1 hypothetical protein HF888_02550 [Bermanella marisrubri]